MKEIPKYGSDKAELEAAQKFDLRNTEVYVHTFLPTEIAELGLGTTMPRDAASAYCIRSARHPKKLNVIAEMLDDQKINVSVIDGEVPERKGWTPVSPEIN
jgi:hypothetical protein